MIGGQVAVSSVATHAALHRRHEPIGFRGLVWLGSLLVAGSSVLHFFLWLNYGYRNIPTISPLFLMQAAVGVVLALWTSASRHWLLVLAEALFVLSSLGGLIISINVSLFNWQETLDGPWVWLALLIELLAGALLLAAAGLSWRLRRRGPSAI